MKSKKLMMFCLVFSLFISSYPGYAAGYYGKKLKGDSKMVYRTLENAGKRKLQKWTKNNTYIRLKHGISRQALYRGWMNYDYDHPDFYWAEGYQAKLYNGKARYVRPSSLYYKSITKDFKKIDKELYKAIQYVKKRKGRYNKVKAAHNYLNRLVSYGHHKGSRSHYSIAGLIKENGRLVVCSGYAKAFQAICLANNIPCIFVTGLANDSGIPDGGHGWNYVQMSDKKWYLVDCTWDDAEDELRDTYFLKGSKDKNEYGLRMEETHKPDKYAEHSGSLTFRQKLPALAKTQYNPDKFQYNPEYPVFHCAR